MATLLFAMMLFLTLHDLSSTIGQFVLSFQLSVSPNYAVVQKYRVHQQLVTSDKSHLKITCPNRAADSGLKLQRFHRICQREMVVQDEINAVGDDQDVKNDVLADRIAADHFFDSAIINRKLQGLNLSDQKLLVLQDAAKRMVKRHEDEMNEVQQHHSSSMAVSIEECNIQHQKEIEKLNRQHQKEIDELNRNMDRRLQLVESQRITAIGELKRTKREHMILLEKEREASAAKFDELDAVYNKDRNHWIESERRLRDELKLVEMAAKDSTGNATTMIHQIDLDLQLQRSKYQLLKAENEAQQERYHHVTAEIEQLRNERNKLKAEVVSVRENEVRRQQQFREQMEIAESAVAASTKRERDLQLKCDSLQQANFKLLDDLSNVNMELQKQTVACAELEKKFIADRPKSDHPILSKTLQTLRKYLWINDQSLLRLSGRWVQHVFVPTIFPFRISFVPMRRKTKTKLH